MKGEWLTTSEVASVFGVMPYTVRRWAAEGKLASVRTARGHLRFEAAAIRALLREHAIEPITTGPLAHGA